MDHAADWKADAQRPMRLATYTAGPGAECGVYFFGAGQGGSVEANLDRWVGQFLRSRRKAIESGREDRQAEHSRLPVTTVDVSGAYTGMGGPTAQRGRHARLPDAGSYRRKARKARFSLSLQARPRP